MKELLNARFFSWLEECGGKDVTREEVELVVGEFVADLERMCDKEKNYKEEVRVLGRVRIRLHVWDEVCQASDGSGKKGMFGYCVEAVLQRVEAEIRFARERQEYPERYAGSSDDGPLAVWTSNNNKMEIAELMLGIYLAKVLRTPDGMLMEYREVIRLAERAFGVKISNHRELKRDIFKRTNELVIFLKRLIFLIEQERDKKDA